MIIDCHGHYTTAPAAHTAWRDAQLAAFARHEPAPPYPDIPDDDLRESVSASQLRLMRERGIDLTLFSPRASAMGHHAGDESVSLAWTRACNDLIARVTALYPSHFAGVAQLPQSPGVPIARSVPELRRCVQELGFVGCNLNPDPSGGHWTSPPLTDRAWYPLYEALCELDVPAMVHAATSTRCPSRRPSPPPSLRRTPAACTPAWHSARSGKCPGPAPPYGSPCTSRATGARPPPVRRSCCSPR